MGDCDLCANNLRDGWWGVAGVTHCHQCHRTWGGFRQAHCVLCCRHFSTDGAAEQHRKNDRCMSDRSLERRKLRKVQDKWGDLWRYRTPATPRGTWSKANPGAK